MKVLLDTNAYSDWRRSGRWNEIIATADEVMIPAIVLGELRYGFKGAARGAENETKLLQFLAHPAARIVDVGDATSRIYATLKHFLRQAGTPIPDNDVWISALAVEYFATVVTADAHFEHLPQVARAVDIG
ncbi:MAG: type II toxin-antitoxin system VapC family toxin [Luteolibacter sp.]